MVGKFATEVTLSWEEKNDIFQNFWFIDVNENGFITAADYKKHMIKIIGQKEIDEDARNFIRTFDVDCNGRVSYDAFIKLTR